MPTPEQAPAEIAAVARRPKKPVLEVGQHARDARVQPAKVARRVEYDGAVPGVLARVLQGVLACMGTPTPSQISGTWCEALLGHYR